MTIYALSSGPGVSGVAIIRISGKETSNVLKLLTGKETPKPRQATLRKINKINTSELIDEGLILWFPGPESYTGEDMAEIHVHGSKAVIDAVHSSLSKIENCRLAEAGEFTKLAFQNGKINLLKAESIADLISAETEIQRLQAVKIMKGNTSEKFNELREKLLKLLSFVEAKIDFPEEDLPKENLEKIEKDSTDVLNKINKILNDQKVGEIIREGFKIAIVGPTNAGKSSLLNNLSNREVAIVSGIAGTTRDVVEKNFLIKQLPIILKDTAGIRGGQSEAEKQGILKSKEEISGADLVIMFNQKPKKPLSKYLYVFNKSDINTTTDNYDIHISAKENKNISKLKDLIYKRLVGDFSLGEVLLTSKRQSRSVLAASEHLKMASVLLKNSDSLELVVEDLNCCIMELDKITNKTSRDDILESVFSSFCVGK